MLAGGVLLGALVLVSGFLAVATFRRVRAVGLSRWLSVLGLFVPLAGLLAGASEPRLGMAGALGGMVAAALLWAGILRTLTPERRPLPPVLAAHDERAPDGEPGCAPHRNRVRGTCLRCGDFVCRACAHPGPASGLLVCVTCAPQLFDGSPVVIPGRGSSL